MVPNFLEAVRQIKADLARHLSAEAIVSECRAIGYTWRERWLGPVRTIHLFLLQVLHGNTACDHVPRLGGVPVTGKAYGDARARLPLELFERLLRSVCQSLGTSLDEGGRWCGHRLWLVDGSSCSMPDTEELQTTFGQPGGQRKGCGFPVAHLIVLIHAGTGLLQQFIAAPLRMHDLTLATRVHPALQPGDVLAADRGFCSFAHLALLMKSGIHAIFRLHQAQIVSFRKGRMHLPPSPPFPRMKGVRGLPRSQWVKWLGQRDQLVQYFKPKARPKWMTAEDYTALPFSILVRELRYQVGRPGFRVREVTIVTTLLDPERYPAVELAQAYWDRWQVEGHLREMKQTLKMDVLRTETVHGVLKELSMFAIVYNLVRLVMLASADQQGVPVERMSFIDALRWLCCYRRGESLDTLNTINLLPNRRGRFEPRVRKRRPKQYPLMKKPRRELIQALATKRPAA
jgi:hypothetical protein